MPRPSHSSRFDYPNNIRWWVKYPPISVIRVTMLWVRRLTNRSWVLCSVQILLLSTAARVTPRLRLSP
jgi:hypothetical protein